MFSANTVIGQTGDFAKEQRHKEGFEFKWPAEGLTTIPDWIYTSPEIYEREIERIFHGRTWNFVALEAEIPNPGRLQAFLRRPDACGGGAQYRRHRARL